jgi:hypothetical protein
MDISLPVSEGATAGVFSGAASSRSVDSGKFSQTLSQEMSERPTAEPTAPTRQRAPAASSKHADAAEHAESGDSSRELDAEGAQENSAETTLKADKGSKKIASETPDAVPGNSGNTPAPEVLAEQRSIIDSLKLLTGNGETSPPETSSEKTVVPSALAKASSPTANSVLADGAINPALLRSNAIHNEIFNSLRTQRAEVPATEAGTYTDTLASGKTLQGSGKNLPGGGKSEKTANADNN